MGKIVAKYSMHNSALIAVNLFSLQSFKVRIKGKVREFLTGGF